MNDNFCYNCFRENPAGQVCPHCGYDPSQARQDYPLALPHGTILNGRYILGRVLGQGGFGITYVAQEWKSKQLVAVKEYLPDSLAIRTDSYFVTAYSGQRGESFQYGKECFLKEAQTLAQFIGNPNIVRVHSYFEENNTAYFAMDYVEGISFQRYIENQGGKIGWQDAQRILIPVMDALEAVHSRGVIHRDVTPDNIFITNDGTVKLLDFGAARYSLGDRSRSLDVVLKHGFAPREQYTRHGRQGPYTDVYSVAASFYYAITGRKPPDSIDRMDEDCLFPPSSLGVSVPAAVEDAILKGLSVQAADRFQRMGEFKTALTAPEPGPTRGFAPDPGPGPTQGFAPDSIPGPAPGPTPEPSPGPTASKSLPKWLIPAIAGAAALLVLFIALPKGGKTGTNNPGGLPVGGQYEPTAGPTPSLPAIPSPTAEQPGEPDIKAMVSKIITETENQPGFMPFDYYEPLAALGDFNGDGTLELLTVYEIQRGEYEFNVMYELWRLSASGPISLMSEVLFMEVGGNSGEVGIAEYNGVSFLAIERHEPEGETFHNYSCFMYWPADRAAPDPDAILMEGHGLYYDRESGDYVFEGEKVPYLTYVVQHADFEYWTVTLDFYIGPGGGTRSFSDMISYVNRQY